MCPGPHTTVDIPARWNNPASVPKATSVVWRFPASCCARRTAGSSCRRLEGRHRDDRLEAYAGGREHGLHRRFQPRRVAGDGALHRFGVGARQVAELVVEAAVFGHHVVGDAAVHDTHRGGGVGHVEALLVRPVVAPAVGHVGDLRHQASAGLDRIHRLRRERRVRRLALDAAAPAVHALVRDGRHHARRLADDAQARRDAGVAQVGDQVLDAKTADLFVEAEGVVQREWQVGVEEGCACATARPMKPFMSALPRL